MAQQSASVRTEERRSSEIQQDIERTMRSVSRTIGQIESELGRFRRTAPTELVSALGRSLGRTALAGAVRRHPFLAVFTAATVGVSASLAITRPQPYPGQRSLSARASTGRLGALSTLTLAALCEKGIARLLRTPR